MIDLYQFPRAFGIANLSPFCMKVEAFLRIADLPFRIVEISDLRTAPKAKLPFIRDNGILISDSEFIIDYVETKWEFQVDGHLDSYQRAIHHALSRTLEEHLYWALLYSRYFEESNWQLLKEHLFGEIPPPVSTLKAQRLRNAIKKQLQHHGLGRHSAAELYRKADKDIEALASLLGNRSWFGGDYISKLDLSAVAFLSNALIDVMPSPLATSVQRFDNLVAYRQRVEQAIFADLQEPSQEVPLV